MFVKCKEIIGSKLWKGLDTEVYIRPLLYFTDSSTYIAFGTDELRWKFKHESLNCGNGFSIMKLKRIDAKPFHMENNMDFTDTGSIFYRQPMLLCSDVETMIRFVPDFNKTEDWLQLVMHEYFHSFQFSHKSTINYLADTIRISADTLDKIYIQNDWFRAELEKENIALLKAINSTADDSLGLYIAEFTQTRERRRAKFKSMHQLNLNVMENFWETIEGTARYAEYYMAGNFKQIAIADSTQCDSLFNKFEAYSDQSNFEDRKEFRERVKMMQAYYYVTGFNLCRLMDKIGINYKQDLFDKPTVGLYDIFRRNYRHLNYIR